MKLALLGTDIESLDLARAAEAAGHTIVWFGDVADDCPAFTTWPGQDEGDTWEVLLDGSLVDAVIVGRGNATSDLRCEQVQLLTKSGMPVLTTFPLIDAVLAYYEIDMARGESHAVLQHYNPLTEQHAIIQQCAAWIADGHPELGAIEQVVWERPLAERTQANVLKHFSRDVELLAAVAERLNRLGALGSPDEAATYAGLSVQLLGKSEVPVRWQVGPIEQTKNSRLGLIAQNGKLTVEFDPSGQALEVLVSKEGQTETTLLEPTDAAAQAIARLANSKEGGASTWLCALTAMELTDTIEISLRRGRMIEVHEKQLTEQLAFKGTMSALGCGLLLVLPPLLLFCGWLAELVGLPISVTKAWPYVLLLVLAIFLLLQFLPKIVYGPHDEQSDKQSD